MKIASTRTSLLATLAIATLLPLAGCDPEFPLVLPVDDEIASGYESLAVEWSRWAMAAPYTRSPVADPTGAWCNTSQSPELWFLAGTYEGAVERSCTIPEDTPLFFPLLSRLGLPSNAWVEQPGNYDDYVHGWGPQHQADSRANTCALTLRLDGVDLLEDTAERDEQLYAATTEPFAVEVNADNWWTARGHALPGGTYDYALADGHWALLQPLSPGPHVLELGGTVCTGDEGTPFETEATYHLLVEGTPELD